MMRMERRLAVMTAWAWLGSFGLCLALSGFRIPDLVLGLAGFALILVSGCVHVVIDRIYETRFSDGEVAMGFGLFVASVLTFVVAWMSLPDFGPVRVAIGLLGFAALFLAAVFYLTASHGVRGTIALIDESRRRPLLPRP